MKKPKRSDAMGAVIRRLDEMQRSAAWLGRNLRPPVSRQTVSDWYNVPEHYVRQVTKLTRLGRAVVRPDLAAIFAPEPKEQPESKKAA